MENKIKNNKFIAIILTLLCLIVITLSACFIKFYKDTQDLKVIDIQLTSTTGLVDTYTIIYSDGSTYSFNVSNGADGVDGQDANIEEIYAKYIQEYGNISYSEFLSMYLNINNKDNSLIINQCLTSSMKIYTEFATTTTSGSGFHQTTTNAISMYCGSAVIYKIYDNVTYIITNYHVVYCSDANADNGSKIARKIYGYLYGSESSPIATNKTENGYTVYNYGDYGIPLTYVGGSITYDIAILKANTSDIMNINDNVNSIKFADNYHVGDTAIAIGNPENEGISATQGIVSVDNENISLSIDGTTRTYRSIRIDTSIYSGSSGGGLFNVYGELIGITNAGDSEDQNINYAIPLDIVKNVTENILYYYDGINISNVTKITLGITVTSENSKNKLQEDGYSCIVEDIVIYEIASNSIASNFEFASGDILKTIIINDVEYTLNRSFNIGDLLLAVRSGDKIKFTYTNNNETKTTNTYTIIDSDLLLVE